MEGYFTTSLLQTEIPMWFLICMFIGFCILSLLGLLDLRKQVDILKRENQYLHEAHARLLNHARSKFTLAKQVFQLHHIYSQEALERGAIAANIHRFNVFQVLSQKIGKLHKSYPGVQMHDFFAHLIDDLMRAKGRSYGSLQLFLNIEDMYLDAEVALGFGLIVSELIGNAFDHAVLENEKSEIFLKFYQADDMLHLDIADDGPGFPNCPEDWVKFGIPFVHFLIEKLFKGRYLLENKSGTKWTIKIPVESLNSFDIAGLYSSFSTSMNKQEKIEIGEVIRA